MIYSIYPNESGVKHGLHVIIVLGWIPDRHTFRRPCWEWNKMTKRFPSRLDLNEDLLLVRPIVNRFVAIQCTKEWPRTLYMSWMTAIYTCMCMTLHECMNTKLLMQSLTDPCARIILQVSALSARTHTHTHPSATCSFPVEEHHLSNQHHGNHSKPIFRDLKFIQEVCCWSHHFDTYSCVQTSSPSWSYSTISWGQTTNFHGHCGQPKILPRKAFFFNLLQASLAVLRQMFWSWGLATYNTTRTFHKKTDRGKQYIVNFQGKQSYLWNHHLFFGSSFFTLLNPTVVPTFSVGCHAKWRFQAQPMRHCAISANPERPKGQLK